MLKLPPTRVLSWHRSKDSEFEFDADTRAQPRLMGGSKLLRRDRIRVYRSASKWIYISRKDYQDETLRFKLGAGLVLRGISAVAIPPAVPLD